MDLRTGSKRSGIPNPLLAPDADLLKLDPSQVSRTVEGSRMRKIAVLLVLTTPLLSLPAFAQDCTTYVLVAAYDKRSGDTVENLKGDDFEARVNGKEIPILNATQDYSNRLLVLLETDSRRYDRVDEAVELATKLARSTPAGRSMAFGVFAKRSVFTEGFIEDDKKRSRAISAVIEEADTLGNSVATYNALHKALAMFGQHQPGDTVVLIGDGYDIDSNRSGREVEREYMANGTRLVMMFRQQPSHVMGDFAWNPPERDRAILQEMSVRTGGTYTMFDPYYFSLASHGYLLSIRLPESKGKPLPWKLRLRNGTLIKPSRVQLHYPDHLPACSTHPEMTAQEKNAP
jgi:hypothetical protein